MKTGQRMVKFGSIGTETDGLDTKDVRAYGEQPQVLTIQPPPSVVMSQYTCNFRLSSPLRKMV